MGYKKKILAQHFDRMSKVPLKLNLKFITVLFNKVHQTAVLLRSFSDPDGLLMFLFIWSFNWVQFYLHLLPVAKIFFSKIMHSFWGGLLINFDMFIEVLIEILVIHCSISNYQELARWRYMCINYNWMGRYTILLSVRFSLLAFPSALLVPSPFFFVSHKQVLEHPHSTGSFSPPQFLSCLFIIPFLTISTS